MVEPTINALLDARPTGYEAQICSIPLRNPVENHIMWSGVTRRQILWGLLASWLGLRPQPTAAIVTSDEDKPHCRRSSDGRLWTEWRPGQTGYYVHSLDGCPFCRSPRQGPLAQVTTYVYDRTGQLTHGGDRSNCTTTYVYDARGRVLWTSSRRT